MTATLTPPRVTLPERDRPGRRRSVPGRHLRPVERPRQRRSPAVPVLVGSGIVIAALFALAVMHALLISGQLRLDDVRREAAAETEEVRRLRLRVAELEAPDRVLEVARERLGMVAPGEVGYLLPIGVPGGPEEPTRVAAAEPPPPPPPPPAEAVTSPEQQEVDAAEASDASDAAATDSAPADAPASENDGAGSPTTDNPPTSEPPLADDALPSEGAPDGGSE